MLINCSPDEIVNPATGQKFWTPHTHPPGVILSETLVAPFWGQGDSPPMLLKGPS